MMIKVKEKNQNATFSTCKHNSLIRRNGYILCEECGEVIDREFDFHPSVNSAEYSAPRNGFLAVRTEITPSDLSSLTPNAMSKFRHLRKIDKRDRNKHSAQIRRYLTVLSKFKSYFPEQLPDFLIEDFNRYYEKMCKADVFIYDNSEHLIIAMFFMVSVKINKMPYPTESFIPPDMTKQEFIKILYRGIRKLSPIFGLEKKESEKKERYARYVSNLVSAGENIGFDFNRIQYAQRVLDEISTKIDEIRKSHAAIALYIASKTIIDGKINPKSFAAIAEAMSLAETTLRQRMKKDIYQIFPRSEITYKSQKFNRILFKKDFFV